MISNYASSLILRGITGKTQSVTLASRCYLALSSTEPQKSGQGVTEPQGNGYVRTQIGYYQDTYGQLMGDPSAGTITNTKEIHFNEATGAWGQQNYACIYDAQTGGNLIAWGALETPISPVANTVPLIKTGELTITVT